MQNYPLQEQDIKIRRLTGEEILGIYTTHSTRHFPEDERKPVSSIRRMLADGIYIGYGFYPDKEPDQLLGYAFFTVLPDKSCCLLDYFAVMEDYRSHGIGSLFLQHIRSFFRDIPGFLIESEDPDYAGNPSEYSIRCKRLDFYKRNGAVFTGIRATVFNVPYRLLFFPLRDNFSRKEKDEYPLETVHASYCSIYRRMVSPEDYEAQIHISLEETCAARPQQTLPRSASQRLR